MTTSTLQPTTAQALDGLAAAVRGAIADHRDWSATAADVAAALREHRPTASVLTPAQRAGSAERYTAHRLHIEPDGSFSILAMVWQPGQETRIHDHVTWCVFGTLAGEPVEDLYTLNDAEDALIPAGRQACPAGTISGDAPPGDIHRITNPHDETAITLHVYGTDVSRIGTSLRRTYDLPIVA